uniref:Disease resistance protein At4g27190-like n=1 Tax=Cicer arietinum TaxID=3827 RepID=A0A3Q7XTP0_CICAR
EMECLTELAKEAVIKLGDLVVDSTVKHYKYLTQHKKITSNLEEEYKKLKRIKETLEIRVNIEKRKGYEIAPEVQKWLSEVTSIEIKLQKLLSDENKANKNKKFFGGKCPDFALNYSLGKQGTKSTEDITSLKEEEKKFKDLSYPNAALTLKDIFIKDIKSLMSRKLLITEVIEKLKDDEVKMISICGMGGVGKTTLVKELIKSIEISKLFDDVVMTVVSQNINYEKIQTEIAELLGIESKKDSPQGRAMQLFARLSKANRVLIVFDDVWDILDFELIGIPFREHEKSCKILFTSRDENVCLAMGSKVNYQVPVLFEEEAWYLFREMAGKVVDRRDINPIAREIAKECGGLPLAIVTVGRALSNEGKSAWTDALNQLKKSSSFSHVGKSVHPRIELSLKFLNSNVHQFFLMLCGLFPEDFDIPIEGLLNHAMGLRLFEDITSSWEARDRVDTLVVDLKRKFLLLDSNVKGCVKMHDIVREVVLSIANQNAEDRFMVQYNFKWIKKEKLDNINALSLILDDTKELENDFECTTLKLLQVRAQETKPIFWPEHFFKGMCALKVLSMQNLCIPKLPSLSQVSGNLNTLQVEYCDVGDISIIGKELIHLEVLSFAHSNIKELPIEIGNLSILKLLDLICCNDLNVISDNVFIRLTKLEELYLRMSNFPWKNNDAAIKELKKISHKLMVIEMKVRGDANFLKELDFNNLQKFWIYVDPYTRLHRSLFLELKVLNLCAMDYQSICNTLVLLQLVNKCEMLSIRKVINMKNVTTKLLHDRQNKYLKYLKVDSCPNLEYLIDGSISQIHTLELNNLKNLKEICHSSHHHEVERLMTEFSDLVELELRDLPSFTGFNNATILNELNQVSKLLFLVVV